MSTTYQIRGLTGCEPDKVSTNLLTINAGAIDEFYGGDRLDFPNETQIDLTTNGLNGLDTGTPSNGELYVYAIKNYTTGVYGWLASKSRYESDVVYPDGFQFVRKLPWGVMYNSNWDGIPDFHLTHWPMPQIRMTGAESSALWTAIANGSATSWAQIDVSAWVPDNAREVIIQCETRFGTGSAGSAYIRTEGPQTTGILVGSVSTYAFSNSCMQMIRVTSDRKFFYQVTGGARLYVYVLGYNMSEPA